MARSSKLKKTPAAIISATADADDDSAEEEPTNDPPARTQKTMPRSRWRGQDRNLFLTQTSVVIICTIALAMGYHGMVLVHEDSVWLTQKTVSFAVGIAVQIAMIAPLELARMICQILFWRRLVRRGQSYRSFITNWSVIYSHSYRGAEDLLKIGSIGACLMLVYLVEVAILGAVGSLYLAVAVNSLKAQGTLPLLLPLQSTALIDKVATEAFAQASESYFNFAYLYDPLVVQAVDANTTCGEPAPEGSFIGCHSVLASPLTGPYLSGLGKALPDALAWANLVEGDVLRTRATELGTRVTCAPSEHLFTQTDPSQFTANLTRTYLYTDITGDTYYATNTMYSAIMPWMYTPQVQVITFGTGDTWEQPPIDDQGRMIFAMHAFNFPEEQYANMTPMKIVYQDTSGARDTAAVLCNVQVTVATSAAVYEILQVQPGMVVNLTSAVRETEPVPFSLAPVPGSYGYSMAMFLTASTSVIGCDLFPCSPSARDPPPFDQRMELVKGTPNATTGELDFSVDVQTMTTGMAKLMARLLLNYVAPPTNLTNLVASQTTTFADVHENRSWQRIYTTRPCNILLAAGIAAGAVLIAFHFALASRLCEMFDWSAMWTTSSVLFLLQALPSQRLPNLSETEWRSADLETMREAADRVLVRGAVDRQGNVRLVMEEESAAQVAQKQEAGHAPLYDAVLKSAPDRDEEGRRESA
ncbi:hypothetical protein BDZ88DRAFT_422585 [Geranomyces variabilis]|nr:hypothetical protein BDZ88DRAFT_422585 [Geranomyces variabilis]KAJ3134480.1 hypothetical protein HDU90_005094 [Geranomyces variabilis]